MEKVLTLVEVLVFYDMPELILARDSIGTKYLCLLFEIKDRKPYYVGIQVSQKKLRKFIDGKIDLRTILIEPELNEWFIVTSINDVSFIATQFENDKIPDKFLPDPDYFYDKHDKLENKLVSIEPVEPIRYQHNPPEKYYNQEEYNSIILYEQAIWKDNAVVHFSLSDETDRESIDINTLGDYLKLYQNLITNIYKKEAINRQISADRKSVMVTRNYNLRAFASSAGSFNIHLYASSDKDLFGKNYIEYALEKVDDLLTFRQGEIETIEVLRSVKGHSIGTLKKIVSKILTENIRITHSWLSPTRTEISKKIIDHKLAEHIYNILSAKEELETEIRTFVGVIKQADVERGNWRVLNELDGIEYSGESKGTLLEGITLDTIKYELICQEVVEELVVAETEKIRYVLMKIDSTNRE